MPYPGMPEISRYLPNESLLRQTEDESDFMEATVELIKEASIYATVAGQILPCGKPGWNRDQGILCGLVVRASKFMSAVLDQTCQHRREIVDLLARIIFETIVNARYLIFKNDPALFNSYVRYSLRSEKQLWERIDQEVASRGGQVLPVEERMRKSISKSFESSGVKLEEVDSNDKEGWSVPDSIYGRAVKVGLKAGFQALYMLPNHAVHGNWEDLHRNHLERTSDGLFAPHRDWHEPRPQALLGLGILSLDLTRDYWKYIDSTFPDSIRQSLDELEGRIRKVFDLHEEFIQRVTN